MQYALNMPAPGSKTNDDLVKLKVILKWTLSFHYTSWSKTLKTVKLGARSVWGIQVFIQQDDVDNGAS